MGRKKEEKRRRKKEEEKNKKIQIWNSCLELLLEHLFCLEVWKVWNSCLEFLYLLVWNLYMDLLVRKLS